MAVPIYCAVNTRALSSVYDILLRENRRRGPVAVAMWASYCWLCGCRMRRLALCQAARSNSLSGGERRAEARLMGRRVRDGANTKYLMVKNAVVASALAVVGLTMALMYICCIGWR